MAIRNHLNKRFGVFEGLGALALVGLLVLNGCGGGGGATAGGAGGGQALALLAGNTSGEGSLDGSGAAVGFTLPLGAAVDAAGNIYVADSGNHTIRKITSAGVATTLAGKAGASGSIDGISGDNARFNQPSGVALDSAGNVYVADTANHTIRKITPAGVVSTLAGSGLPGSADGTGTNASFGQPAGIAVDTAGNIYVAASGNCTIRKITPAGVVSTLAGMAGQIGSTDGTGANARFSFPQGVAVDTSGNVFVADTGNNTLRKITPAGVVSTLAGAVNQSGVADGAALTVARFVTPTGIAVDASGNVYVADQSAHTIRKITNGQVNTLAGEVLQSGFNDGAGISARFNGPAGLAVDGSGHIYIADSGNTSLRKLDLATVMVSTLAGSAPQPGNTDGAGADARFDSPTDVAVDAAGNVYVADSGNLFIRKIDANGVVGTLGGVIGRNSSIALDSAGNLYTTNQSKHTILKITPAGAVSTLAGTADQSGSADGTGANARFYVPMGIALDGSGNVYVADTYNVTIRKITPAGVVSTLAGTVGQAGSTDGVFAKFNMPRGIAVDGAGNVYVADTHNHTIRMITPLGITSTLAGVAGQSGSTDGTGTAARFNYPADVTLDDAGHLYVADGSNFTVRKIDLVTGAVTTVVGQANKSGFIPGDLPGVISYIPGITWRNGSLYFPVNNGIAKVKSAP